MHGTPHIYKSSYSDSFMKNLDAEIQLEKVFKMNNQEAKDAQKTGTGFMASPTEAMQNLQNRGYRANIIPRYDHFEINSGEISLFPRDFVVDKMVRFENASDPDDQSIIYAISAPKFKIKGIYMEGYGIKQDELSAAMNDKLQNHEQ